MIRWTPLRKAALVETVRSGLVARGDVLRLHGISDEEFRSWETMLRLGGPKALRVCRLQGAKNDRRIKTAYRRRG
jgi:hypothetical protein